MKVDEKVRTACKSAGIVIPADIVEFDSKRAYKQSIQKDHLVSVSAINPEFVAQLNEAVDAYKLSLETKTAQTQETVPPVVETSIP